MKNLEIKRKPGRPIVKDSKRQIELKSKENLRSLGLIKKGRPIKENSKRQEELKRKSELKELGLLSGKKGRPVNPNSKRQEVLNLRESGLRRSPGRPKQIKEEGDN